MPKGTADWKLIKELYQSGLSAPKIEQHPEVKGTITRQAILKRARGESWPAGPTEAAPIEPGKRKGKIKSADKLMPQVSIEMRKELRANSAFSDARARAVFHTYSIGGTKAMAAAMAGVSPQTLERWMDASPSFKIACEQSMLIDAQESVEAVNAAMRRGDWKAADRKLGLNQLTKQEWSPAGQTGQSGGPSVTVVLNIDREQARLKDVSAETIEHSAS